MKISKLILITLLVSAYATVSVINIQLAKPKDVAEVTLDMMDIMSRAFDESEGGETVPGPNCYWTYQKKWLQNNWRIMDCNGCDRIRVKSFTQPGECTTGPF